MKCLGGEVDAKIVNVLPQLNEATRATTVVLDLDPSEGRRLSIGEIVRVEIDRTESQSGYWLPTSALVRGTRGLWACLVVSETRSDTGESGETVSLGLLQRRDLEVLYATESKAFVRGMLKDGDRVVSEGTHRVVQGQWVELLDD